MNLILICVFEMSFTSAKPKLSEACLSLRIGLEMIKTTYWLIIQLMWHNFLSNHYHNCQQSDGDGTLTLDQNGWATAQLSSARLVSRMMMIISHAHLPVQSRFLNCCWWWWWTKERRLACSYKYQILITTFQTMNHRIVPESNFNNSSARIGLVRKAASFCKFSPFFLFSITKCTFDVWNKLSLETHPRFAESLHLVRNVLVAVTGQWTRLSRWMERNGVLYLHHFPSNREKIWVHAPQVCHRSVKFHLLGADWFRKNVRLRNNNWQKWLVVNCMVQSYLITI